MQTVSRLFCCSRLPRDCDAQAAWRFNWVKGETLTSKVEHVTTVDETIAGKKNDITSKLLIAKRWRVLDVDAQGTATLEQSLASLRNEQFRPGGEKLLFDSLNLDTSTPELTRNDEVHQPARGDDPRRHFRPCRRNEVGA